MAIAVSSPNGQVMMVKVHPITFLANHAMHRYSRRARLRVQSFGHGDVNFSTRGKVSPLQFGMTNVISQHAH
jgi:hypothetical protein